MAMRWRWPPDSVMPRSPVRVAKPCGRRSANSLTRAAAAAASTSSSVAWAGRSGCCRGWSRENSWTSCGTSAMRARISAGGRPGRRRRRAYRALIDIVKAQQQVEDGCLAGARWPDNGDPLTRRNRDRQPIEGGMPRAARIGEMHIANATAPSGGVGSGCGLAGARIAGSLAVSSSSRSAAPADSCTSPTLPTASRAKRRRAPHR